MGASWWMMNHFPESKMSDVKNIALWKRKVGQTSLSDVQPWNELKSPDDWKISTENIYRPILHISSQCGFHWFLRHVCKVFHKRDASCSGFTEKPALKSFGTLLSLRIFSRTPIRSFAMCGSFSEQLNKLGCLTFSISSFLMKEPWFTTSAWICRKKSSDTIEMTKLMMAWTNHLDRRSYCRAGW